MIVEGSASGAAGNRLTLDDLFRRAGVRHPEAVALADPPNRESFTAGPPRRLTYVQADRAISAFAAKLRGLGLPTDTVVGLQFPNTVEGVVALLGTLRAGMIAAPLPSLWHKREIVAALGRAGAKAIVTAARIGVHAQVEIAMRAAAELFPIRYVCGFGSELPDGVVPLDDVFAAGPGDAIAPPVRPGLAAAHVAVATFEVTKDGIVPVMRNHNELIAAGMTLAGKAGLAADAPLVSTIPPSSFAGIAVTLMPWLLAGGTLHLHHGFDAETFAAQSAPLEEATVVLPGPVAALLHEAGLLGATIKTAIALWRAPERLAATPEWHGEAALVDVAACGETNLTAARRGEHDTLAETNASAGVARVGGYRFVIADLEAMVAEADPAATIVALPDALFGERLAGSSAAPDTLRVSLEECGANPLISGAFRRRKGAAA